MKKVFWGFLLSLTVISFNVHADIFNTHSEQWDTNVGESAMDRVGEQRPIASPVTGTSYTSDVDSVGIIRDARVKAIEYSDRANQAKGNGNMELAKAYQQCSEAMNTIAVGFEKEDNTMIAKGRTAYKTADAKVKNIVGEKYSRINDPRYQFTTFKAN